MLTLSSFFVSVLHTLPFSNSILIALFIISFADWRKDHPTRALLLFFIVHPSLVLFWTAYGMVVVEPPLPVLDFFTMYDMVLLIPVFYNFIYAITTGRCMDWKRWVAFYLPLVFLFAAYHVVTGLYGHTPFLASINDVDHYWSHPEMKVRLITFLVRVTYGAIVVVGTYLNYQRYKEDLDNDFSTISARTSLRWLYAAMLLYIIYLFADITSYINNDVGLNLFAYSMSITLNVVLAFFGFAHKSVYSPDFEPLSQLEPVLTTSESQVPYQKMEQRFKFLCNSEQIWRNSELAATDVIAHLHTNRTYFSQFLQDVYKTNFRTCINTYRVSEAQKMIRENPNMNMMDIYVQCGFASSSSFNEWFKKITGKSPSEYKEEL